MAPTPFTRGQRIARRASVVLLALAALFAGMWIVSAVRGYAMNVYTEVMTTAAGGYSSHQRAVAGVHGRLWFAYVRAEVVNQSARFPKRHRVSGVALPEDEPVSRYNAPQWLAVVGLDWRAKDTSTVDPVEGPYVYEEVFFSIPFWLLVGVSGGAGWWIGRRARLVRRRHRRGLCVACGYDVRATPQRCPECGREPAVAVGRS